MYDTYFLYLCAVSINQKIVGFFRAKYSYMVMNDLSISVKILITQAWMNLDILVTNVYVYSIHIDLVIHIKLSILKYVY